MNFSNAVAVSNLILTVRTNPRISDVVRRENAGILPRHERIAVLALRHTAYDVWYHIISDACRITVREAPDPLIEVDG